MNCNISPLISEKLQIDASEAYQAWCTKAELIRLLPEQKLDPVYFEAFIHRSFQNENNQVQSNYERLEFLGDSVLQTWVTRRLYDHFEEAEGKLSVKRSAIVNESNLAKLSKLLGFGEFILLGKGETADAGFEKEAILCDVFEAYLGASYLQLDDIENVFLILDLIAEKARLAGINIFSDSFANDYDDKTQLQNLVMQNYPDPPRYDSKELSGEEYKYEVSLIIGEKVVLTEKTDSIKKTQKQLAKTAINKKLYERPSCY